MAGLRTFRSKKASLSVSAVLFVGLVFGADILASQRLDLVTLPFQRLFSLAEDGAQRFYFLRKDRANGVFDDVFDDVIRGIVAAGSFAFATVILKIDGTSGKYLLVGILAAPFFEDGEFLLLGLSVR